MWGEQTQCIYLNLIHRYCIFWSPRKLFFFFLSFLKTDEFSPKVRIYIISFFSAELFFRYSSSISVLNFRYPLNKKIIKCPKFIKSWLQNASVHTYNHHHSINTFRDNGHWKWRIPAQNKDYYNYAVPKAKK